MLPALVVVSDHSEALLASVSEARARYGTWTRKRSVALIAPSSVKHDIFLAALAEQLRPELAEAVSSDADLRKMSFG